MIKLLTFLLILPFKILFFVLGANANGAVGNENSYKTKTTYKPVGKNGELIQVTEKV
jgi:hypothetical protein